MAEQFSLSLDSPLPVSGLSFRADAISTAEEARLIAAIDRIDLPPFAFQRWTAKRRTKSFGYLYDFRNADFGPTEPIPDFLNPVRTIAAGFAGVATENLVQVSIIRYDPGAGIGWHRDRPELDAVIGFSLGAPTVMRFRRRRGTAFERANIALPPRSLYLLAGEVRYDWEHSIAPMDALRWSVTFRGLAAPQPG
ncbi:alpha-ketoglutarate-dependent dioxygenase AlkB [Acidisoma cellulosilytica]|uniref:Alpha-ketoglutarate-dependent dioxygenase AlkB n=1 Tax=Acidisoma cellulosilyticum TaxID=2802395 RepID=A0A963Z889_9PROT|nr:alpha-ketoglutarate-dependent dioxygenase AlkB [Acidisoma cellulosilyticum]MCB8883880.1 alpha-ketoglutarate-dependent dioxygenase AlkB [Acidisoma cellulosilyticum]